MNHSNKELKMDLSILDQYQNKEAFAEEVKKTTFDTEMQCHGCGQVLVHSFVKALKIDDSDLITASSPFFGGMALTGNTCGALLGGLMVLGLIYGRKDVSEEVPGLIKGVKPLRKFIQFFGEQNKNMNCRDITGTDLADPQKAEAYFAAGGLARCAGILAQVAGYVADLVYENHQAQKAMQAKK